MQNLPLKTQACDIDTLKSDHHFLRMNATAIKLSPANGMSLFLVHFPVENLASIVFKQNAFLQVVCPKAWDGTEKKWL